MENKTEGLVHIYCGEGKGKTTAALGLGLRACGRGKRVLLTQFLKSSDSGERIALKNMKNFTLSPCPNQLKFTFAMTEQEKKEAALLCDAMLEQAVTASKAFRCEVLILDEIFGALSCGMLEKNKVLQFIKNKPEMLELILTGRDPAPEFIALADYVSEINKVKHPYEQGINAREGIEY